MAVEVFFPLSGDRGRGGSGRGFRGGPGATRGMRGSSGGDRGGRGSFRGERGSSMTPGFRGSNRGIRGSKGLLRGNSTTPRFRGSTRGSFRGTSRGGRGGTQHVKDNTQERNSGGRTARSKGPYRGKFYGTSRGGRGGTEIFLDCESEIALGLQLSVIFKGNPPREEELMNQLPGFHSMSTRPGDVRTHYLLFKDLDSLEAAKEKLQKDDNISSVDYNGMRSSRYSGDPVEARQLYMKFRTLVKEEEIKKLDNTIVSVIMGIEKRSCLLEYATPNEAIASFEKLKKEKRLPGKCKHFKLHFVLRHIASCEPDKLVLRDVPRKANISHIAKLFPEAVSAIVYEKTFPTSEYCHAVIGFPTDDHVKNILKEEKHREILGKKIYIFPAYPCFFAHLQKLGAKPKTEQQKRDAKILEGSKAGQSPSKKIKLENDKNKNENEEGDNEDDEDMESADDENGEGEEDEDDEVDGVDDEDSDNCEGNGDEEDDIDEGEGDDVEDDNDDEEDE